MVCMGNICRSPTAHGVMQCKLEQAGLHKQIAVDSAGTHAYHVGEPPDARSQHHAVRRGYDLSAQRARQFSAVGFAAFDVVLVMDDANERAVRQLAGPAHNQQVMRLAAFALHHQTQEVPDPYYGGDQGFEYVLDLVEDACDGLLKQLIAYV
ncbi:low molecular weight phosphotyrosine protein phosphatase [Lampropedia puyangensis]|uniref:protein-tyrosine-phosphatase n=1 Tax=Lampropedia puyangensis TaxID=1330072 RepID=A0A4V4GSP1_9BURK|nr:low molecular weight protein-tyrosine-phosphatase [Lampropedia puyangensis]THU05536.1 low molecular weight phosphotyrosine protein phosphatase [Lampropedia puyangensis]